MNEIIKLKKAVNNKNIFTTKFSNIIILKKCLIINKL
jgi:hypothetical protein